jgi:hypothetical protein
MKSHYLLLLSTFSNFSCVYFIIQIKKTLKNSSYAITIRNISKAHTQISFFKPKNKEQKQLKQQ